MNIMKEQIVGLFENTKYQLSFGLWFSGYERKGLYISWYANEQMRVYCYYKNGKKEGECISWYSNGQIMAHYYYKNNYKVADFIDNPELKSKYNVK